MSIFDFTDKSVVCLYIIIAVLVGILLLTYMNLSRVDKIQNKIEEIANRISHNERDSDDE